MFLNKLDEYRDGEINAMPLNPVYELGKDIYHHWGCFGFKLVGLLELT